MDIARIENLELLARQVVEGFIIGLHKSPFHGFSVEFAEHRLYNAGDPLKHIDWRVYGRTDKLFIKKFEEETNLRCCVVMDTSSSMLFPQEAHKTNKLQFSCLAAASILELLRRQMDAAAIALFEQELYDLSECRSSHRHYRALMGRLESLLDKKELGKTSNIAGTIHQIADRMHKRSLIILFTDLMDVLGDEEALFAALQHLKFNKHEVILFHVMDGERELDFNLENRPMELIDMENETTIKLQPAAYQDAYREQVQQWLKSLKERCQAFQIDFFPVDLRSDVTSVLYQFLLRRNKLL